MGSENNDARMKAKINERNRTFAERRAHCLEMAATVRDYLRDHFRNGRTLAQLRNDDDPRKNPQIPGQHGSISIVRLPLPAAQDGLFVIKDRGPGVKDSMGVTTYALETKDLWAEASAMSFIGLHTEIPVPWIYSVCGAAENNPELSFFAMEYIEGTSYHAGMRLTENQKNRIIRQMATIRIRMIEITSKFIGGVNWPIEGPEPNTKNPHPAGAMSGPRVWDNGRKQIRNLVGVDSGPYATVKDFVIGSFQKELSYYSLYPGKTVLSKGDPGKPRLWKTYIASLMKQLQGRKFSEEDEFHLTHGDLVEGNNITLRGGKITAIIDWETAAFLPFSEAITELLPDSEMDLLQFMTLAPGGSQAAGREATGHPRYEDWINYREKRFGNLGSGRAWPLEGKTGPEPLAEHQRLPVDGFEDSDLEYSDGEDETVEEVGGDWWQNVAVPDMWRLVEAHIMAYGINGSAYSPQKWMWSDPVVNSFGLNNLDPVERLSITGPV